jgi:hypothetical protein
MSRRSNDADPRRPTQAPVDADAIRRAEAIDVRKKWMRLMDLDESEIEEHCGGDTAIVLEEEISQLRAIERVRNGYLQGDAE